MALALSGQRLVDGEVVYLAAEDRWVDRIDQALIVDTKPEGAALEARAAPIVKASQIVNAVLVEVGRNGEHIIGKGARELIRSMGPTVRLDLGKQARPVGA